MSTKSISQSEFKKLVSEGKTKEELATYFGLSKQNIAQIASQLGVTFKRKLKPKFELIDDEVAPTPELEPVESSIENYTIGIDPITTEAEENVISEAVETEDDDTWE